jgi:hypothetical protein
MKKAIKIVFLLLLFTGLTSASLHKFYVSVNQLDYVPEKKAIEITSRLFIDDMDLALEKRFGKKIYLGTSKEIKESKELLQKYFQEKFAVKVNEQEKEIRFLGKEVEDNVLICYFTIKNIEKISSIEIKDTILMELYDQQHIFHTHVLGKKQSLLLTSDKIRGQLNY